MLYTNTYAICYNIQSQWRFFFILTNNIRIKLKYQKRASSWARQLRNSQVDIRCNVMAEYHCADNKIDLNCTLSHISVCTRFADLQPTCFDRIIWCNNNSPLISHTTIQTWARINMAEYVAEMKLNHIFWNVFSQIFNYCFEWIYQGFTSRSPRLFSMLEIVVSWPEYIRINCFGSEESVFTLNRSSTSFSKKPDISRFINVVVVPNLNQYVVNVSNVPPGLITSRAHSGNLKGMESTQQTSHHQTSNHYFPKTIDTSAWNVMENVTHVLFKLLSM